MQSNTADEIPSGSEGISQGVSCGAERKPLFSETLADSYFCSTIGNNFFFFF